jgi:hypothetical protein
MITNSQKKEEIVEKYILAKTSGDISWDDSEKHDSENLAG